MMLGRRRTRRRVVLTNPSTTVEEVVLPGAAAPTAGTAAMPDADRVFGYTPKIVVDKYSVGELDIEVTSRDDVAIAPNDGSGWARFQLGGDDLDDLITTLQFIQAKAKGEL